MKKFKVLISGGGTGGHIFPAIAIARAIEKQVIDVEFLFVGAKDRMEMEKVPQEGYKIIGLWISGLQRGLDKRNLLFPFKLLCSIWRAKKIIKDFKPDALLRRVSAKQAHVRIIRNLYQDNVDEFTELAKKVKDKDDMRLQLEEGYDHMTAEQQKGALVMISASSLSSLISDPCTSPMTRIMIRARFILLLALC